MGILSNIFATGKAGWYSGIVADEVVRCYPGMTRKTAQAYIDRDIPRVVETMKAGMPATLFAHTIMLEMTLATYKLGNLTDQQYSMKFLSIRDNMLADGARLLSANEFFDMCDVCGFNDDEEEAA